MYNAIADHLQRIRIRVMHLVRGTRSGEHLIPRQSASGMEFDSLREYREGDDVRRIDWSSSVRSSSMMVRTYHEQENRTIILMLDLSATSHTGSTHELKDEAIKTIALIISCAAEMNGDAVGLILLHNGTVYGLPPHKGSAHIIRCAELITPLQGAGSTPTIQECIAHIERLIPRQSCVVLISDGLLSQYARLLDLITSRASCAIIRVRDRYECAEKLPIDIAVHDTHTDQGGPGVSHQLVQEYAASWYATQNAFIHHRALRFVDIIAGTSYDQSLKAFLEQGI